MFNEISSSCNEHEVGTPNMNNKFMAHGRPRQRTENIKNNYTITMLSLFLHYNRNATARGK